MTIKHCRPRVALGIRRCVSLSAALAGAAFGAGAFVSLSAHASDQQMIETGSSLLYPLFNLWIPEYVKSHGAWRSRPRARAAEPAFRRRSTAPRK